MPRPAWSGHLKLSLVTCPVELFKATEASKKGVRFNLLNPETKNRIKMKPIDAEGGPELQRSELVKGFEVDKGLYVTVTDDELRDLKIESNGAIQIERFCAEADIDRLYWGDPYYLVPGGKLAQEPFAVIREAMREGGQVALARVVMNGRERQFALEARGKGIVAHAIRTHQEVRPAEDYFEALPEISPQAEMVDLARMILKQHAGPFDPTEFTDRYQEAVVALVKRKQAEEGVTRQGSGSKAGPDERVVVDLMSALKASIAGTYRPPAPSKPRRAPTAAIEPAKAAPAARRRRA